MTQNKFNLIKIATILTLMTLLVACQNNHVKPTTKEVNNVELNQDSYTWQQLQQSTLNDLREQSYGEAENKISLMMTLAGEDHEKWEYIRMAIISLPEDLALKSIDQSLKNPFVKKSAQQMFAFSRVLTQLKHESAALELVNKVIKKDKQSAFVYWRARLLLLLEQEDKAEKDYLWLLKQEPDNVTYISQYATLLSYLDRNDEALVLIQGHDEDIDLLFREVILLIQDGQQELAETRFSRLQVLIDLSEISDQKKLEIAELAYWMKEHDFSLKLLQQVKTGDQVNEAKILMANVLVDQGNYERAAVIYHQVQNGPEQHAIPAYQLEIELYRQQEKYTQAMEVAHLGLQMFSGNIDLLYSRAMLYGEMDDIASLEKDLQSILLVEPDNPDALNALGYTWADNDMNLELAYEYITKANALKPNDKAILDSVGWVYYKKGDLEKAEKYLRMAIKNNTRDSESFIHLIEVLQKKGDQQALESIIQLAQELFPDEKF